MKGDLINHKIDGGPMITVLKIAEPSEWACYMYGGKPGADSIVYRPNKECVPNWFVRFCMKIFLGCTWVRVRE